MYCTGRTGEKGEHGDQGQLGPKGEKGTQVKKKKKSIQLKGQGSRAVDCRRFPESNASSILGTLT